MAKDQRMRNRWQTIVSSTSIALSCLLLFFLDKNLLIPTPFFANIHFKKNMLGPALYMLFRLRGAEVQKHAEQLKQFCSTHGCVSSTAAPPPPTCNVLAKFREGIIIPFKVERSDNSGEKGYTVSLTLGSRHNQKPTKSVLPYNLGKRCPWGQTFT